MSDRPNILYLYSDQHAAHVLGCCGNEEIRTPNLDRLASQGARFENAFSQCAICAPSRMSIYTGCYPTTLDVRDNFCRYPVAFPPLIPHLRDAGYATAAFGKMHFNPGRRCAGFDLMRLTRGGHVSLPDDDWRVWLIDQDPAYGQRWPYGHEPDFFDEHPDFERNRHLLRWDLPPEHYVDTWVANEAIEYLQSRQDDQPFFMWVGFTRPHDPYIPAAPYDALYDPASLQLWPQPWGSFRHNTTMHDRLCRHRLEDFDHPYHPDYEGWLREALAAYYGQVSLIDASMGRVLATLDDLDLSDNTVVLYGTDHGEFAGRYGLMGKFIPGNDAMIRVPMIWRVPGLSAGIRHAGLVENVDTFPTLFDLAGLPIPEQCQGMSLRPALEGDPACGKDAVYFRDMDSDGMRTAEWTWVRRLNGNEHELYDLEADLHQENNLYKLDPNHSKAAEMDRRMTAAMAGTATA